MENLSHSYLPNFILSKNECINIYLGIDQEPKSIQVYKGMGEAGFSFLNTTWMFLLRIIKI